MLDSPGNDSLLGRILTWIIGLCVLSIVIQILVLELVRWVTVLAPWLLLGLLIVFIVVPAAAIIRRRYFY